MSIDPSSQLIPDRLDWVEIRWVGRPIKSLDVEVSDKFINNASTVGLGVVILKDSPLIHPTVKRNNDRLKNVVHRPLGIEISINNTKPSFLVHCHACPNHYQTPTKSVIHADSSVRKKSFSLASIHPRSAVIEMQIEPAFTGKEYSWPLLSRPLNVLMTTVTAGSSIALCQCCSDGRAPWSKVSCPQSIPNWLEMFTPVEVLSWCYKALAVIRRFLWVMLQM